MPGKWKRLLTGSGFIDDLILAPGNGNDTPPSPSTSTDECVELGRELAGQICVTDKGGRRAVCRRQA